MSGHTPGPWTVAVDMEDGWYKHRVYAAGETLVANVLDGTHLDSEANARLIAASPRLAVALKAICDAWEQHGDVGAATFAEGLDALTEALGPEPAKETERGEAEANGLRMAASKELLAACEAFLGGEDHGDAWDLAVLAVRKAKGEVG